MIEVTEKNAAEVAARVKAGELPAPAKSLAEAMVRVMEQVGYVQKTGQMMGHARYSYARESDFIAAIRPEMVRNGITFCPTGMESVVSEAFEMKSGSRANRVVLRVTFTLMHAPSGDRLDVVAFGEGIDSGDKACNKAMTAAMKYALRQSFVIETGDDPDDTPSQAQERAAPVPAPAPKSGTNLAAATAIQQKYEELLRAVGTRNELEQRWREFDAEVKAGLVGKADKAHIDGLFKGLAKQFPKAFAATA